MKVLGKCVFYSFFKFSQTDASVSITQQKPEKKMFYCAVTCILALLQVYGGIYPEDKHWYRCRVKELVDDDKVHV